MVDLKVVEKAGSRVDSSADVRAAHSVVVMVAWKAGL